MGDLIDRQAAIDALNKLDVSDGVGISSIACCVQESAISAIQHLPSAQYKYEYHYDHTDCIWYRPEARNRCPSTCAQYRDGWNDAMNYIFRDGKGYMPYRRDKQYGE